MPEAERSIYEFGPFRLDSVERQLLRDGQPVTLTDKVFELLLLLVRNHGHALSKAELMDRLWPDTAVEENNLTVNISILRKALGETASERRYIETLARRGYRFVGVVETAAIAESVEPPLPPREIAHPVPAPPSAPNVRSAFVGRERELARLEHALNGALAGNGRVVFVTGPPGMGKTELCEQFVASAAQRFALSSATGHCLEQYGTGEAYLPFLGLVRELLAGPERKIAASIFQCHAPSWCAQFPAAFRVEELDAGARGGNAGRLLREMADALEAFTRATPALLVLEDLHWADPSSTDLLRLIAQRIGGWRALVLATVRAEQVELENHPLKNLKRELLAHDSCDEIVLPLLERSDLSSFLDARFPGHALPRELAELVAQTSEGQPLFATRLVQLLVDRGDIVERDGRWTLAKPLSGLVLGVPDTVRGLIERKLESLEETDRRALQYASAIGLEFTSALLAALLSTDEVVLEERLDQLARAHRLLQLLGEEPLAEGRLTVRYRFAHVLYQNVIHDGLASKRRIALHARIAEHLLAQHGADTSRVAAQLALHFESARDFARAIDFLMEAADNASRLHATREATRSYARALELVERLEPRERSARYAILHYNLGWCRGKLGDHAAGIADFEAMLEHASDPGFTGPGADAERAQDRAYAFFQAPWRDAFGARAQPRMQNQERSRGPAAIQCEAYWGLCYMLLHSRRFAEMERREAEYLQLAEASNNEPRRVEVLAWMASREIELLNLERAVSLADESIRIGRALGHVRALFVALQARACAHHALGAHALAEACCLEAFELGFEAQGRIWCLRELIWIRAERGDIAGAFDALNEARAIAAGTEREDWLEGVIHAASGLNLALFDFERALQYGRQAAEIARRLAMTRSEVRCSILLARIHAAASEPAQAAEALERVERLLAEGGASAVERDRRIERLDVLNLEWAKAEHRLARDEFDAAKHHAEQLARRAAESRLVVQEAVAWEMLARIALARADLCGAEHAAEAGLRVLGECELPLVRWRLLAALARGGGAKHARARFDQARDLVERYAHCIPDDTQRAIFRASREVLREERS